VGSKTMRARWSILVLASLVLSGCGPSRQAWVAVPHGAYGASIAWDGLGQDPNVRPIKHVHLDVHVDVAKKSTSENDSREATLATLREYSREWVSLRKEIEAAEDARIAKILVICTGC
jgi:hypothetical protein